MAQKHNHLIADEFRTTIATAIAAAFGFVIALTWNDFIKAAVDDFLLTIGATGTGYAVKLAAAVIVTIIGTIGILLVSRWKKK
jgi:hypothetical protein